MWNNMIPAQGSLLVSEPFMMDPHFQRSVVLLCEHDVVEGTVGYVLNQDSGIYLQDLINDLEGEKIPVYFGGPVEQQSLHFIHRLGDRISESTELGHGLFWGGSYEEVLELLGQGIASTQDVKFFMGYAGWSPGQLDEELTMKNWMVCNDFHPDIVLLKDGEDLWKESLIAMGPKFAHVANFPINPQWN
jgi:putative transcriptional regulator